MFQNDDVDLIAEQVNPNDPDQVRVAGRWQPLEKSSSRSLSKARPRVYHPTSLAPRPDRQRCDRRHRRA